jgi:hypothetical protein
VAEDALCEFVSGFVEAIHVELAYEAVHLVVAEVTWQHNLLELASVFNHKLPPRRTPENNLPELLALHRGSTYG